MSIVDITLRATDDASGPIKGVTDALDGLGSLATGALAAGLATAVAGFVALGAGIAASVSAALDNEKLQASLTQAIKASGGAAGLTAKAANDLAQQFTNLAGGSDDAILAIETIGIRAGTISSEQMPAFIKATLDLGAVMGDTASAATLLARAQEDPVAALGRLQRAGIIFSADLKDQIKNMAKAGDMAGATALIMQRVAEATGGAAAANAETLSGQWEILKGTLGEAAEAIGMTLLPVMHELNDQYLKPAIPVITQLAGQLAGVLAPAIGTAARMIGYLTSGNLWAFTTNLEAMLMDVETALGNLWTRVQPVLTAFITSALAWVQAQTPGWLAQLQAWGQAFIDWVTPMIPPLLLKVGELEAQLFAWVQAQIPPLLAQLQTWGQQFVAWVEPQIPPLMAQLQALANRLLAWLGEQIPPLVAQLLKWGQEFVAWVGPQIEPMLVELGKLLAELIVWVWTVALPAIVTQLRDWALAFADWVMKPGGAKDQVLPALSSFLLAVGKFVVTDMIPGFIGFAKSFIGGIITGLQDSETVKNLMLAAETLANKVMDKIRDTINNAVAGIAAAAANAVRAAIAAAWAAAQGAASYGGPAGIPGTDYAVGADFIVPPGFPNDTFGPMFVQSGEHVKITPAGKMSQAGGGPGGPTLNFNIDARGSQMTPDQFKDVVHQVLGEAGYIADNRIRMATGY